MRSTSLSCPAIKAKSTIEVRRIEAGESVVCARIFEDAWNAAFPRARRTIPVADFDAVVEGEITLVAIVDRSIAGYVSVCEADWFIHHLYVDPPAHRAGIGSALLSYVEGLAESNGLALKCLLENVRAMRFYEKRGFTKTPETGADRYGAWVRLVKDPVRDRAVNAGRVAVTTAARS